MDVNTEHSYMQLEKNKGDEVEVSLQRQRWSKQMLVQRERRKKKSYWNESRFEQ